MATDAEVKLNFTARIEQARAAIKELSSAMQELTDSKARLDELSAAYQQLQASGGQANEQALSQIKELQEQVATLTKQQEALVDKVVSLQVENNKLAGGVKEVATETEKAGLSGVRVTRSMRGIIANFIRDLARGKLAVRELGLALKGLAYSTVVLGAIQLAMDGIGLVWEKIKGVFSQSEEEMQAAQEAAERAQKALDDAKREAERAAGEVQRLKEELAKREEAEALKETLAGITAEYVAQRDAVNDMLAAIKEQAQVKARERAAEAAAKTGEMDMELLGLEERFVSGDIGKRDYVIQKAEIEKRKREEQRNAAVDSAEIAKAAAEAERDRIREELDASNAEVERLNRELSKKATPEEAELARKNLEATRKEREAKAEELAHKRAEFNEKYSDWGHLDGTKFVNDGNNLRWMLSGSRAQMNQELAELRMLDRQRLALKERERTQKNAADAADKSSRQYQETARRLDEERKTAAELGKKVDVAETAARKADNDLRTTLQRTAREGGQDDRMTAKRVDIELVKIDRQEREKQQKEREKERKRDDKTRSTLQKVVDRVTKDTQKLATDKDKTNDTQAFRMIGELLETNGKAIRQYGVNVSELLNVCAALDLQGKNADAKMATMEAKIRQLQRQVDKRTAKP
ncbi:MAG: hypothetical protein MJ074_06395 [Oscillospiraceae bacterium]|nr:hypothetical protein [Oscillospiraceae bacterium]